MRSPSALLANSSHFAKPILALAAGLFGLYWVPLRALDAAGITGAWAASLCYGLCALLAAPLALARWRRLLAGDRDLWITALIIALSLVGYSTAFLLTEVVKVILLYYLTPIWSTLLSRAVLKQPITAIRWLAILLGFAGVAVIFRADLGVPLPDNLGDWLAFAAGILWAIGMVRLQLDRRHETEEITFALFIAAALVALLFALLPGAQAGPAPPLSALLQVLPWLLPVVAAVIVTSSFLVVWGCRIVDPGLAGLLFLTEISVSVAIAALITDEPFGLREISGVILISAAGLAEIIFPPKMRAG